MLSTDHPFGKQRSIFAAAAIYTHTDHTAAAGGDDHGSILISHQQNAGQGKASGGVLGIRSLNTNKRTKGIHPSARGSLLHPLIRRQRGETNRWCCRR